MTIGNITSTFFPPDWNPTDVTSLGTQVILGAITFIALSAIACNRNRHSLTVENTDDKLTIVITGGREGVPQRLIDEANAAIRVWEKAWSAKLLEEDGGESFSFSAEKNYIDKQHTLTLAAEKVDSLDPMQQAAELRFLQRVTFTEIPKKQKTGGQSAGTGAARRRPLPISKKSSSTP
ncbi:MAG: hypothetical protein P0S96_08335 [Simkaniaceae bacterium]|nr:hypothetical protein [Candidatus Sacchlamyda saccharinae]